MLSDHIIGQITPCCCPARKGLIGLAYHTIGNHRINYPFTFAYDSAFGNHR